MGECLEKWGQVKGESQETMCTWNKYGSERGDPEQDDKSEVEKAPCHCSFHELRSFIAM